MINTIQQEVFRLGGVFLLNFNPRSRTGSDFSGPIGAQRYTDFNPRSRTGSDHIL